MAPVLVAGLKRFLDQETAKSRTVDEQIPADFPATVELHGFYKTIIGAKGYVDDFAFGAVNAASFGILAQVTRVLACIKMISVRVG